MFRSTVSKLAVVAGAVAIGGVLYYLLTNGNNSNPVESPFQPRRRRSFNSVTPNEMIRLIEDTYDVHVAPLVKYRSYLAYNKFAEEVEEIKKKYGENIEEIKKKVQPPPSLLFIGLPGIGKSEAVKDAAMRIAEKYGLEFVDYTGKEYKQIIEHPNNYFVFVDLRLTSVEPADLMGLPRLREVGGREVSDYVPFGWAEVLSVAPGVLFLDEFTNIQRDDVMAAAYQLVLDRRAGFTKFSPDVMIIAAGNSPEQSAIARELPAPALDRFEKYDSIPPTLDDWVSYMYRKHGDNWSKWVLIYASATDFFNTYAMTKLPAETLEKFPTPRSLTRLAVELYRLFSEPAKKAGKEVDEYIADIVAKKSGWEWRILSEKIEANIGKKEKDMFLMIVGLKPLSPEELLKNPDKLKEELEKLKEDKVKMRAYATAEAVLLALWMEKKYRENKKEEIKKNADKLGKIADILFEYLEPVVVATMMMPACRRRDVDVKQAIADHSKHMIKEATKLLKIISGEEK